MPMFCRHNRLTQNCPICSRELQAELPKAPPRTRSRSSSSRGTTTRAPTRGVVTRKLARAADDGYRNPLVPGIHATADAERLAAALAAATVRPQPPGPYPEVAAEPDLEEATWLAFLLALAGPGDLQSAILAARPSWEAAEVPDLPGGRGRTVAAYRAWAARAGSQAAAFRGEESWTPARRFARVFERLALPGFARAARFDLLTGLGAAGRYELEADQLQVGGAQDATTDAAKRVLVSGDTLLLERRARDLAGACGVPLAALDRGLADWGTPGVHVDLTAELPASIRAGLSLR
jgi:hypothetical protein